MNASPVEAVKHPNWSMGPKISVDSATLMNKGLELIEAHHIFGIEADRIDVLIHPQSIVHGLVAYRDGSIIAEMGVPDMRMPIAHCLSWPKRSRVAGPALDLAKLGRLNFARPDLDRFPALKLARQALAAGGWATNVLNAANEVAVAAFLEERIGFMDIPRVVEASLGAVPAEPATTLATVEDADRRARAAAAKVRPVKA